MAYSRESLNEAVSLKLTDLDQATGLHKALFTTTQVSGVVGLAGAVLIAPLALEVGVIVGAAGGIFYGISQLVQSKRVGHFLPVPGVGLSAGQLTYGLGAIAARIMGESEPVAPDEVKLIPSDWLPEKERRINYLLTHCPDIIISAAERAQDGISFAAIVDSAVRASEFAITDAQISNPITSMKLAGEVRKVLTGDTSGIEAQQRKAIAAEYKRAQTALAAGNLSVDEFADIEAQVFEIAPNVLEAESPAIAASATPVDAVPVSTSPAAIATPPTPDGKVPTAYEKIIASPYRSRFFLGGQRTGKSYLAISCAHAAAQARGTDIYYLNLSSWGSEDMAYGSIADTSIMGNIQALTSDQAKAMVDDARKLLQKFFISDRPSILVLEEWCEMGSRNHQHKDLLDDLLTYSASIVEQLANTGQKREKAIYATGPMFVAGSLQQATKAAKSMSLVLVGIAPDRTVYWNGQALAFDHAVFSMASNNWHGVSEPAAAYGCDRIALCEGAWMPVGAVPKLPELQPRAQPSAKPPAPTEPPTIDVESTPANNGRWQQFKAGSAAEYPGMDELMDWASKRDEGFTERQAKQNSRVRDAIKASGVEDISGAIADLIITLVSASLIEEKEDGFFELSQ